MLTHYEGVLKIEGEVGNKKDYDPRGWLTKARGNMAQRVVQACEDLKSVGKSLGW